MNQDYIIFSSIDWSTHWQIHHQLTTSIASNGDRVLFVENTGIRSAKISDFGRLKDRMVSWKNSLNGYKSISNNIIVYSPILLPFPYSKISIFINKLLFNRSLTGWLKSGDFTNPIVISFLPTPVVQHVINHINHSLLIYYCANDFSNSSISAQNISSYEDKFINTADLVFAISHSLVDKVKKIYDKNIYYLPPGIDYDKFHCALTADNMAPKDLINITSPIIGYVGALSKVLDQDLICSLANYFPDYTIVLVGPKYTDISKLEKISNIIILGSKSHDQIPYYIKEFDVALIPYICNKFTDGVYPSKLFEYISMGKPVVSTKIREVDYISNIQKDIVVVSKGEHDFINSVESEIYNDKQSLKDMRIKVAVNNSWDLRFKEIKKIIDKHLNIELKSHANVSWKNKFSLYIQKKNRYRNLLIIVFLVIVMKLYSPLFWLIGEQLIVSDSIEKSDAIVVFSGDGEASYQNLSYQERALNAINIYKDGYADKIFLSSGREQTIADVEIIKLYLTSKNVSETSIYILDKYPNSTYQNVNLVKEKLVKNNVSSIIFVTSPYHSLRSVLTWKKNAPNIRINTPRMTNKLKNDAMWDTDLKKIRVIMYEYAAIVHNWFTGRI